MSRLDDYAGETLAGFKTHPDAPAQMVDLLSDLLALAEAVSQWRGNPSPFMERRVKTAHDSLMKYGTKAK
jgi:hypothetical protein